MNPDSDISHPLQLIATDSMQKAISHTVWLILSVNRTIIYIGVILSKIKGS